MDNNQNHLKESAFNSAGFTSKIFFSWMFPFIRRVYGHKFTVDELSNCPESMLSHSNKELLQKTMNQRNSVDKQKKLNFKEASWCLLRKGFYVSSVFYFIKYCLLSMANSIIFWILISSMDPVSPFATSISRGTIYTLAAGLCLSVFFSTLLHHHMYFYAQRKASALRVATCALVYQKVLHMSKSIASRTTTGQLLNIISADSAKFDQVSGYFMCLISVPFVLVIGISLLIQLEGPGCLAGVAIFLILAAFQMYQGKLFKRLRSNKSTLTDERLKATGAVLSSMRIVKLYGWEKPMAKLIVSIRKKELLAMNSINLLRAFNMSLFFTSAKLALFATVLTDYLVFNNVPKSGTLFVVFAIFNVIRVCLTFDFPGAIERTVDTIVAVRRMQKLFDLDDDLNDNKQKKTVPDISISKHIHLENTVAVWEKEESRFKLATDTLHLTSPLLVIISGQVGSGKSSFLMNILREMQLVSGSIDVFGKISYVPQNPWLFPATIRQNIIFGMPYDQTRYMEVIRNCALEQDIESLKCKDLTNIGDKGVTLSGGQKARINLARAVYRDADIYLLDDPLSAVDFRVAQHLIHKCLCGMLSQKLIMLVTHQIAMLENLNIPMKHIVMVDGTAKLQQEMETNMLKKVIKQKKNWKPENQNASTKFRKNSTQSETSSSTMREKNVASKGFKGYFDFLRVGNGIFKIMICVGLNILAQVCFVGSDILISLWTKMNDKEVLSLTLHSNNTRQEILIPNIFGYKMETQDDFMLAYAGITLVLCLTSIARSYLFFWFCLSSSTVLHDRMLDGLLYTYISFFDQNPVGRILNRFSKDLETIDDMLPASYLEVLTQLLMLSGVVVILAFSNRWLLVPVIGLIAFACFIGIVFFKISRRLKTLEAISRSSVYTHFETSIDGQVTIRALEGASSVLVNEFDRHQDIHSATYFASFAFLRWFSIWLDIAFNLVIAIITFTLLYVPETTGTDFGLVLATLFSVGSVIPWVTRLSAELQNQMVSYERILEYVGQTKENGYSNIRLTENDGLYQGIGEEITPKRVGRVFFKDVSLRYGEMEKYVLKSISFNVNGGEKIGIVGRTGAGKSSLVVVLFRLTSVVEGQVFIDDVDTASMSLEDLRHGISIIPQDPVLFSTSIRYNLDPFDNHSDESLWNVLESVQLKEYVQRQGKGLGLLVIDAGSNFSVGQRQLLCLARALLRTEAKIVILDEATSSVDNRTDMLIQDIVKKHFAARTVFTIAHRLDTVINMDKIMVIDDGHLVEFDNPTFLMKKEGGHFRKLIDQARSDVQKLRSDVCHSDCCTKL